jgi:DNA adenine methylase
MKTFIKWSGNKTQHMKNIIKYIPKDFNRYIEPFIGSGSIFLKVSPEKWIINDINNDLINIWKNIINNNEKIIKYFDIFSNKFKKLSKDKQLILCRNITENIEHLPYNIERAAIYMLMNNCNYTGNLLINNKFYFQGLNMHITKREKYYFLTDKYYNNLKNVACFMNNTKGKIYNMDYKKIIEKTKKNDFVFLDPPYVEEHNYGFNYNKNEILDNKFLDELYKQVKILDKRGVKWLMTQADTKEVKKIFKNYTIKEYCVYRAISKKFKKELIIMNY